MKSEIKKFYSDLKNKPFQLILCLLAYLLIFNLWGGIATLFLGTAVMFAIMKWDSRVFMVIGLLFLISCPLYLLQRKELMAEEMAVYAYYSLFLGVMLQLIEYWRENKSFSFNKKTRKP